MYLWSSIYYQNDDNSKSGIKRQKKLGYYKEGSLLGESKQI